MYPIQQTRLLAAATVNTNGETQRRNEIQQSVHKKAGLTHMYLINCFFPETFILGSFNIIHTVKVINLMNAVDSIIPFLSPIMYPK